ncbi:hypothetical protein F4810DRAFT_388240 [Camillea tinctor]|nr:hypothetical protein F4810DRAFT_388240 [Camillea tinctor]
MLGKTKVYRGIIQTRLLKTHESSTKLTLGLCHRRDGRGSSRNLDFSRNFTVGVLLRAVAGDVAGLAALVASLASSVERTTIGRGAIPRDVTELPTGVALHGLSLAIASKVVGATALVAGSRPRAASEATAGEASISTTASRRATADAHAGRVGASTS